MIKFEKMHGLGNDFILFDGINEEVSDYHQLAQKVCDRNFGIGADGIMIALKSEIADIKMLIFNSDGSEAMMCGNGLRCFSKYVFENNLINKEEFSVETLGGIMRPKVYHKDGNVYEVRINLGKPIMSADKLSINTEKDVFLNETIVVEGKEYLASTIQLGCLHTVIFVDDLESIDVKNIGPIIENHNIFNNKTNVNFCKILDDENIKVLTWEIGAGQTLACGTGASSVGFISSLLFGYKQKINTHLLGGKAQVEIIDGDVYLIGPAELICKGVYSYSSNH